MKEHLQIFDTKKFLRTMLVGMICYMISFVITLLNIKTWGFFTWLLVPTLLIISFFPLGLSIAKGFANIEINQDYYNFNNNIFHLKDISSYDFNSTGNTCKLNIRLKNSIKISFATRKSYHDSDRFMIIADKILIDIKNYNSQTNSQKIFEYDFYKSKNAKIVGVLFILFDIIMTYLTIFNDSKRVPTHMKYFGAIMINIMIFSFVFRIFKKK